mmetsp:Transcript_56146/g.125348  ORF Transcript_56146/g.125348 Transcript_56146/m.125348 type:complete len:84 (-) Transcript_56146:193-444(-)
MAWSMLQPAPTWLVPSSQRQRRYTPLELAALVPAVVEMFLLWRGGRGVGSASGVLGDEECLVGIPKCKELRYAKKVGTLGPYI